MDNLNNNQIDAINNIKGPVLVIAGAGSGKTRVLVERINYLIKLGVEESLIYAFTFTNKATREMKIRLNKLYGRETKINISNFHTFALGYINQYYYPEKYKVMLDYEKKKVIENIIKENKFNLEVNKAVMFISKIKNRMTQDKIPLSIKIEYIKVYFLYQDYISNTKKLDFDEMNYKFLNLLNTDEGFKELVQDSIEYLLVDECQDINRVQYDMVKLIADKYKNIFMVGDSNQSIYRFRGSDNTIINDFVNTYNPKVINLDYNYRSTQSIIKSANKLIDNNKNKFNKPLISQQDIGTPICIKRFYTKSDEAEFVTNEILSLINKGYEYKDFLILYRMNNSSTIFDIKLNLNNIPHMIIGKNFTDYLEVRYILSYYELILNQDDNEAFVNIVNVPKRKIGDVTLSEIRLKAQVMNKTYYQTAKTLDNSHLNSFIELIEDLKEKVKIQSNSSFYDLIVETVNIKSFTKNNKDLMRRNKTINILKSLFENNRDSLRELLNNIYMNDTKIDGNNVVELMTIHQAKGLENKVVFLVDMRDAIIPNSNKNTDIEEERRIFYVGMTRAKERLYILSSAHDVYESKEWMPSRFINEAI